MEKGPIIAAIVIGVSILGGLGFLGFKLYKSVQDRPESRGSFVSGDFSLKLVEVLSSHSKKPQLQLSQTSTGKTWVYELSLNPQVLPMNLSRIQNFVIGDAKAFAERITTNPQSLTAEQLSKAPYSFPLIQQADPPVGGGPISQEAWEAMRDILANQWSEVHQALQGFSGYMAKQISESQNYIVFKDPLAQLEQRFISEQGDASFLFRFGASIHRQQLGNYELMGYLIPMQEGLTLVKYRPDAEKEKLWEAFFDSKDESQRMPTEFFRIEKEITLE